MRRERAHLADSGDDPAAARARTGDASNRHIRGSSLLLVGRGVGILINFAIQVIVVRYLSKADYGAFAYAFAFMMFGSHVAGLGLGKGLNRFVPIYQERREHAQMAGAIVLVLGMIVTFGAALVALVYGLGAAVGDRVAPDATSLSLLLILVCMAPVQALDDVTVKLFAIFASPRAVFLRRYVLTPGLKLAAVVALLIFQGDAAFLAVAYVVAGVLGVALSLLVIAGVLRQQDLLRHFRQGGFRLPARSLLRFSLPLLSSDLVHALRGTMVVFFLGFFHSATSVAAFRAVLPVARLNVLVFDSFKLLFMPAAARMYAREDRQGIDELYWRNASWILVFTFPIFALSFAFARPLTLLLFGTDYADSGAVLALLSFGIFVNAAFGFNALTLQVFRQVRTIVRIDLMLVAVAVALNVVLVRALGALGGALAVCGVLILQNVCYQVALVRLRAIEPINAAFVKVLLTVLLVATGLFAMELAFSPHIAVAVLVSGLATLLVARITGPLLGVEEAFPELRRFAPARWLLGLPPGGGESGGAGSAGRPREATARAFTRQLRDRAARYFDGRRPEELRLSRKQVRLNWTLYHFDARVDGAERRFVVKASGGRRERRRFGLGAPCPLPEELRLSPLAPAPERARLECAALTRIHAHFADRGDARFGALRILDYVAPYRALVMEESPDATLEALLRSGRPADPDRRARVLHNTGAWLRVFHQIPAEPDAEVWNGEAADFHRSVDRFADYLLAVRTGTRFLPALRDRIHMAADALLPKRLPLAVVHGDFVPRNVFVAEDGRVTVFDTRSQWRAPTWEDVARFLVALPDCGATRPPDCERAFLEGYFEGEPVPLGAIRLFQAQRVLCLWAAAAHHHAAAAGPRKLRKRRVLVRQSRRWRRRLESILEETKCDE